MPTGKIAVQVASKKILKDYLTKNEPQLWLFVQFIYYCFIRLGELLYLKIADIDFDEAKVLIRGEISKNKKSQYVIIPQQFYKELIELKIQTYHPNFYIFGKHGIPSAEKHRKDYFSKRHTQITRSLGISNMYSLYSWKHTGAIDVIKAGINVKDLQLQLRHHSLEMVDVYLRSLGVMEAEGIRNNYPTL